MEGRVRVGLIGFGTIGTGVVRLLQEQHSQIRARLGARLDLVRIADIDVRRDRGVALSKGVLVGDGAAVVDDPAIDIVIELMGGYGRARDFVLRSIANGKSVVTANKALLAVHGAEIFAAAEAAGVDLGFEASIGGGIPIIRTLREALVADRNRAVYGIVNGTSNYILSRMAAGAGEFDTVLRAAQDAGLAEADPSFDVDGIDSAHKLSLLIQLAFGGAVPFADLPVEGIRNISQLDMQMAEEFGYAIKLLAIAKLDGRRVEARVHPTMVPRRHLLADVHGAFNAIAVEGEALGSSLYVGLGAGMMPTATAVVADVVDAARKLVVGGRGRPAPLGYPMARQKALTLKPMADVVTEYYLRFLVADRPNVLAKIAGILGEHRISIASLIQRDGTEGGAVPIVMRTHRARERNLRAALVEIDELGVVRAPTAFVRIENEPGQ